MTRRSILFLLLLISLGAFASFNLRDNLTSTWKGIFTAEIRADRNIINSLPIGKKNQPEPGTEKKTITTQPLPADSQTISILGVGDMMLGTNFPDNSLLPPNDGKDLLTPVRDIITSADVAFGNLEGVFLTGKGPGKNCSNPAICYSFKMPDHYVEHFKDAGFDVLSVANNHVNDFGQAGTKNTISVLKKAGIHHAGLTACPYTTFTLGGKKYGFVAFAPNSGTVPFNNFANAQKIIKHLDTISDIVIVSFHGGAEGATRTHITRQDELFIGENRGNPYAFARMAIDAGGDIIFGHGPHVTRAIDLYKERFIAYSMGNFATYGRFNLKGPSGLAPIIVVDVDNKGKFIRGRIHSIKQIGEGGPLMDQDNGALKQIMELTKADIPEAPLNIAADGVVTKR
jgi:poly-gamma-glutamate capsule biosynthesis protein CapA/YwtB (metallophosphatase superfamily)